MVKTKALIEFPTKRRHRNEKDEKQFTQKSLILVVLVFMPEPEARGIKGSMF